MGSKPPTRKDVAKRAGVSETIVSYVLNNNRYVKQEKREKVLKAVKELGYQGNRFARALKGKKDKHIMFLTDRIRTEYYGELISDIEKFSQDLGYLVSISMITNTVEYVNKIISWQVDGVIISSIRFKEELIQKLVNAGIPVILMKNREYNLVKGVALINTGLYEATKSSIHYLYDINCRHIAYLDRISSKNHFSDMRDYRLKGYLDGMKEVGLGNKTHIITQCHTTEEMKNKILNLIKEVPIDGIFGRNDFVAQVAMHELIRNGYRVPEDVSIIGLDNSSYSQITNPRLSSLRMQREKIAKETIKIIENMNNGQKTPKEKIFIPKLIIRESVKQKNK